MMLKILIGILFLIIYDLGMSIPATAQSLDRVDLPIETNTNNLLEQGKEQYKNRQFRDAIATLQTAAQFFEKQGKIPEQAQSLLYLSWTYQALGQYDEAERIVLQSIALLEARSPAILLAIARNTLARLQMNRGQLEEALNNWEIAEILYRQNHDKIGQLGSQINQVQVLEEQGRFRLACDRLLQAFDLKDIRCKTLNAETFSSILQTIARESDPLLQGLGLRSLGVSLQALGNLEQSREAIAASLAIFKTLDLTSEIAQTLLVLGNTERFLGADTIALEYYEQAAQIALTGEIPEDRTIAIESFANQFSLFIASEELAEAQTLLTRIRPLMATLPHSESAIYAQLNIFSSWLKLRQEQANSADYQEIFHQLTLLHERVKQMKHSRAESQILGILGLLYEEMNREEEAILFTQQAIDRAQSLELEFLYQWQGQLAHLLEKQGKTTAAIATYRDAIATFEKLRRDLIGLNPKLRYNFRDRIEPIYRNYIALQLKSQPSTQQLQNVKKAIEGLRVAELEDFLQEVCLIHQELAASATKLASIYTMILHDRVEILVSFPNGKIQHYPLEITPQELKALTVKLRQSFSTIFPPQYHLPYAQKLYEQIIQPLENDLKTNQIETLAFVLDGVLQTIPIAVFHDGERYLLEQYQLVLNPGLQLLVQRSPQQLELTAIAAGLSEAKDPFTPLPAVIEEVAAIDRQLSSKVLLNEDFTAENLQKTLRERPFPILHLATHGQFSSQLDDTFLLLWDGPLKLKTFANLLWERESGNFTPIELLVLSACQTAKGDDRATLGLAGISVRSGARTTLATLWSVGDESTAQLMATFYRFLVQFRGDRARALRQAQISLLQDPNYQHPYYWAPFILVGYWR